MNIYFRRLFPALFTALILGLSGTFTQAQVTIDSYTSDNTFIQLRGGRTIGSTFNAGPSNVNATSVRLKIQGTAAPNATAILHIYDGANPVGQACIGSSAMTTINGAGFVDFTLTSPVSLVAGQTYSWLLFSGNGVFVDVRSGSPAPPKTAFIAFSGVTSQCPPNTAPPFGSAGGQAYFEVFGSAAPVPTLSQWGLILFGLSVLCIGGIVIHRRRTLALKEQFS